MGVAKPFFRLYIVNYISAKVEKAFHSLAVGKSQSSTEGRLYRAPPLKMLNAFRHRKILGHQ